MTSHYIWKQAPIPVPDGETQIKWVTVPDFELLPGTITLITGQSGLGKSHFLSHLAGVADIPNAIRRNTPNCPGDAEAADVLRYLPRPVGGIVWVPQHQSLREDNEVQDEVTSAWVSLGLFSLESAEKRFADLLPRMGLAGIEKKKISELSGGQRKRLTLLLRLGQFAPYIFLDEPEAGLDEETFQQIFSALLKLWENYEEKERPAFLIVSHQAEKIKNIAKQLGWGASWVEIEGPSTNLVSTSSPAERGGLQQLREGEKASDWESVSNITYALFQHDFSSRQFRFLHLGVPFIMISLIALCQEKYAARDWSKSFFFINVTGLWVGVQGGMFLFNRHLATWREDETWAKLAMPTRSPYTRHFHRLAGVGTILLGAGFFAWLAIGTFFWLMFTIIKDAPADSWHSIMDPIVGVSVGTAITLAYGYLWGVMLSAGIAHVQFKVQHSRANNLLSNIAAPAVMLAHVLFSVTYLNGECNALRTLDSFANCVTFFNPLVIASHLTEELAQLQRNATPYLHWKYISPLALPLALPFLIYWSSYNAIRAKDLRA